MTLINGEKTKYVFFVRLRFPFDGTSRSGHAYGPVHKVVEIKDHCPIGGRIEKGATWILDNGEWQYPWNLEILGVDTI